MGTGTSTPGATPPAIFDGSGSTGSGGPRSIEAVGPSDDGGAIGGGTGDQGGGAGAGEADDEEIDPGARGFEPFVPGPDSRRVRLSLDPATAWLVESVPSAGPTERVADRVELELFVGGDAWLERLLLRLGPDVRVVDPPEYRSLAADAASRILRRYEHPDAQLPGRRSPGPQQDG